MRNVILGSVVAAVFVGCSPAAAQNSRNCAPRGILLSNLANKYGEARQTVALRANGSVLEQYANLETGSWTVVTTDANGVSCMLDSGQNFELVMEALPAQGIEG